MAVLDGAMFSHTFVKRCLIFSVEIKITKRSFFAESHAPPVDAFKDAMSTVGSQGMFILSAQKAFF